ncbi:glycogen/starch/alpha-glucan phosphorylase [Pectinatus brassicae]|uniref:Alpha-1,4 glucan phosphorylase n=1 Tax=Pectinatus brassicae TaxID=862415 RepID=A0A840UMM5_9FIRM|nr:glycogen/starch/alpha-glucan phosphorylase [Pectinatus brassicae]MBB5335938.1 starch phosphorylase [Pectinatus brassicae]
MLTYKALEEKNQFERLFLETASVMFGQDMEELSKENLYQALVHTLRQYISNNWIQTNKYYSDHEEKQIYYFSIEFLLGRLLNCNIMNLDIGEVCNLAMQHLGIDLDELFEQEPDAGLGNGGLGRLAACFIDSMASLGIAGHGCSIRYQYGLFEQKIIDNNQVEIPDNWLKNGFSWEYRKAEKEISVKFAGNAYMKKLPDGSLLPVHENYTTVSAVPYDVPIVGYHNGIVNTLRLWNAEVSENFAESGNLSHEQLQEKLNFQYRLKAITNCLYPDDSSKKGKILRLTQEYFFVSAGIQSIVRHYKKLNLPLIKLPDKIAIHINDTHPAMAIPELMRILVDIEHMNWDEAWDITIKTMAYTNHTILPEALETWSIDMFKALVPRIYMIIDEINRRFLINVRDRYPDNEEIVHNLSILQDGLVHMARLAVIGSHSVNGVAKIHSDILKDYSMKAFHEYYPHKFNNKTNGITHRRWLMVSNPQLSEVIDDLITDKWRTHPSQLIKLLDYKDDTNVFEKLYQVKQLHKNNLSKLIKIRNNITIDPESIFDIQIKRIHSYKRQIMNIFHLMHLYNALCENPNLEMTPRTFIFGGKAAPSYHIAKETIRLINTVASIVNNDKRANKKMKIVFLENYGTSLAEKLFPAANVSEQISTAGKEASGTSNMKFMMNGAITLGTLDGANVEIHDAVGSDNCVIFGLNANEILSYYQNGHYSAWNEYNNNSAIHCVVDQLLTGPFTKNGDFQDLYNYLFGSNDEYFVFKDFPAYCQAHKIIEKKYQDKNNWQKSSLINIAHSGIFSSDRTISEYAKNIWNIHPIKL